MEILQRSSLRPTMLVSRPSILISPSRSSLNKRKSAEIKEDLPAPVRPTTPTFQPGSMDTFRFYKARLRDKIQKMFARIDSRFIYTFKTGGSSLWYFMLTFFKINCPWDGHVGGGGLSEVIGSSLERFVYWRILSTEVISDIVSLNCFKVYCIQLVRINDCDIARPALLPATLPIVWRITKKQ